MDLTGLGCECSKLERYLPRWRFSERKKEPKAETMIMQRGLKAVKNTGPLLCNTNPCT